MRFTDTALSLPSLMVIIILARILGRSVFNVVAVLTIIGWMPLARVIRGQVLALKEREFVEAARALGVPTRRILSRHLSPQPRRSDHRGHLAGGGGRHHRRVDPQLPRIGRRRCVHRHLGEHGGHQRGIHHDRLVAGRLPGSAIVLTALCANYVGDGLRDAFDPTLKS